jgi:hypothetical protein
MPVAIPTRRELDVIGDLHGSHPAFMRTKLALGMIDPHTGNYVKGARDMAQVGDVFFDRRGSSFQIAADFLDTREQVREAGGDFIFIPGNHDLYGIGALCGNTGYLEWIGKSCRGGADEWYKKVFKMEPNRSHDLLSLGQEICYETFQQDPEASKVLEVMRSYQLVHRVGKTIIMHAQPGEDSIDKIVNEGVKDLNEGVKDLNEEVELDLNQKFQKYLLACLDEEDKDIRFTNFVDLDHEYAAFFSLKARWKQNIFSSWNDYWEKLYAMGIRRVITGHSFHKDKVIGVKDIGSGKEIHCVALDRQYGLNDTMTNPNRGEVSAGTLDINGNFSFCPVRMISEVTVNGRTY